MFLLGVFSKCFKIFLLIVQGCVFIIFIELRLEFEQQSVNFIIKELEVVEEFVQVWFVKKV